MAEAAGSVKIILAVDSTSYSAALDKAKAQLKQLEGGMHSAAATTKHEMAEAKGTIALLGEQIGVSLPRHIRSFIAELPGVAEAMSAAFSTVAVVGIGLAIFEAGKKVYEFVEKSRKAAETNAEAWEKSTESIRLSNLELDVSTIHLQNELAKLEHKPENKLAEALAEAALEAEKLNEKLQTSIKSYRELVEKQGNSAIMQIIARGGGTNYEQTMLSEHARHMGEASTVEAQLQESVSYGKSLAIRAAQLQGMMAREKSLNYGPEADAIKLMQKGQVPEQQNIEKQLANDAARAELAKGEARKDAIDAQKQAAEKQMQEWRRELDAVKAITDFSVQQEAVYWQALADSVKGNSPLLIAATEEANKAAAAANKKYQADLLSGWVQANSDFQRQTADDLRIHSALEAAFDQSQRELAEAAREQQQAAKVNYENTAAEIEAAERMQEAAIKLQEQRGQLSHAAAALQIEQLHAGSEEQRRQALIPALLAGADLSMKGLSTAAAAAGLKGQADEATRKAATALGALEDSATELAAQFTDIPAHIKEALNSTVNTINGALLRTLTDPYHRGQWKDAGKQIFTGMAGSGLKMAEGAIGKMIPGLGKRGESAAVPMFVSVVGGAVGAAGSVAGAIGHTVAATGSSFGSFVSTLFKNILFRQGGGDIPSGMPAVVGESGPELFIPASSGRIFPNRTLNMAGGSVSHVINVDARGAGDPAAVEAAVHRTMGAYMAQLPAMTIQTMQNYNARRPSGARV
jgi:hypothetical protein